MRMYGPHITHAGSDWLCHVVNPWVSSTNPSRVHLATLLYHSSRLIMSKPVVVQLDEETIRGIHGVEDLYALPSVVSVHSDS